MKLAGIAEIAALLKVSRPRARQLADREDFPRPLDRLRMGPVWKHADIEKWIRKHRAGASTLVALLLSLLVAAPASADAARMKRLPDRPAAAERLAQHHGVTLVLPDGTRRPQPYQRWLDQSRVPTPPGSVTLDLSGCPVEEMACTAAASPIWIDVSAVRAFWPSARVDRRELRKALLHETGHQVDYRVLTDADRDRFRELIGDVRPWRSTPDSPHEQFAEGWAMCAWPAGWRRARAGWFGGYGYEPTMEEHWRVCELVGAVTP